MCGRRIRKSPRPHPPPARAVRPRPSRLSARVGPSDSSLPPAPPAGGKITLQYPMHKEQLNSLAGTWLRSVALRSAKSPLARYFTLDRERRALLRCESLRRSSIARSPFAARAFAGAPSLEVPSLRYSSLETSSLVAPMLRPSSLGTSSLVAPMLRPSSLGDSPPSISLPIDATDE